MGGGDCIDSASAWRMGGGNEGERIDRIDRIDPIACIDRIEGISLGLELLKLFDAPPHPVLQLLDERDD